MAIDAGGGAGITLHAFSGRLGNCYRVGRGFFDALQLLLGTPAPLSGKRPSKQSPFYPFPGSLLVNNHRFANSFPAFLQPVGFFQVVRRKAVEGGFQGSDQRSVIQQR